MKITFWEKLSIRIVILFVMAMFVSHVPQYMRGFFGDWWCTDVTTFHYNSTYVTPHWHWGWQHWLWVFMCICLFIVQSVRIYYFIENQDRKGEIK